MDRSTCFECKAPIVGPGPNGGASGYARRTGDDATICYPCSAAAERATMATVDRYIAYVSGDGRALTTWPGEELAQVVKISPCRFSMARSTGVSVRAVAADGAVWYGRGAGRGMSIRIRRARA